MPRDSFKIDVQVQDSTALARILYDPDTELMDVTYTSGGVYSHDNITPRNFARLVELSIENRSWGSGFNEWKKEKMTGLVNDMSKVISTSSPNNLARFDKTYQDARQSVLGRKVD